MSILDKKGINVTSGFKLISGQPIDTRMVVDDEDELVSLVDNGATYEGQLVYVKSLDKYVSFDGSQFNELETGGGGAYVEGETLYLNAAESGSSSGSSGGGLTLIGNYLIEYSEEDAGYKVIHSIDTIPRTSLYVEIKNPEDGYAIFTGLLSYASATIINGYGYMFGTSISVPNANAVLSLLWIVDPDFANSLIDLRLSISSNSQLVPLDGYIISVYTLN